MLKKAKLFLCLAPLAILSNIKAQNPNDKIVFTEFNQTFFKELLFKKLLHIRDTIKSTPLEIDDALYQAADMHAQYLVKSSQVSNAEEGKYPTVEDRVDFFKGNYGTLGQLSAAANVGKTTFLKKENKKVIYETYEEVAEGLMKDIFSYSSNKKYLDNPNFSNLGLALGIDEPGKRIYAVFVLANKPYKAPIGVKMTDNAYGLKDDNEKCADAIALFKKVPASLNYGAFIEKGEIFFQMSSIEWFDKFFEESIDAIAIDLIHKDQYSCDGSNIQHKSPFHDGILLPLIKKKSLIKGNTKGSEGKVLVSLGRVPAQIKADEYEANVIFVKSKCSCQYSKKMPFVPDSLSLLHMGLYIDTLNPDNEVYMEKNPNKIKYSFYGKGLEDVTKEIEKINKFLATPGRKFDFESLEAKVFYPISATQNETSQLATQMANNILYKLQIGQPDTIKYNVNVFQNWLAFYQAINGTKYDYLKNKSREDILLFVKTDQGIKKDLDSIFSKPFKFDLTFELQVERVKFNQPFDDLKAKIDDAVSKDNFAAVKENLNILFTEIHHKVVDKEDLKKLEIPRKPEHISSLIALESFKFLYGINSSTYSYDEFTRLNSLSPGNKYILYNIAVLNIIKSFESKDKTKNFDAIFSDIQNLLPYNLNRSLMHKLNANYYFLKAYKEHRTNQPKRREEAVKTASGYCFAEEMNDENLHKTINNYAYFSEGKLISPLLGKIVAKDHIDTQLLVDFVKYIIISGEKVDDKQFVLALENAMTLDPNSMCGMFASSEGSFQLKETKILKDFSCRHCK